MDNLFTKIGQLSIHLILVGMNHKWSKTRLDFELTRGIRKLVKKIQVYP